MVRLSTSYGRRTAVLYVVVEVQAKPTGGELVLWLDRRFRSSSANTSPWFDDDESGGGCSGGRIHCFTTSRTHQSKSSAVRLFAFGCAACHSATAFSIAGF